MSLVAVGCGSKGSSPTAQDFDSTTMAEGVFANIEYPNPGNPDYTPTTPLYASILDFPQARREDAPAGGHAHPSGFVYGLAGMTMVNLDDGTHLSVGPGQAIFAPPFVHHSHSNPGNDTNDWLFIGLRPEAARTKPLPSPEARVIINTADIPPLVVGGQYASAWTNSPSARVGSRRWPNRAVRRLSTSLSSDSLHQLNATTQTLGVNQASFLPQDSVYQLRNPSKTDESQVLIMTMWLQNSPANTIVDTPLN